jgi:hypothetical protein
MLQKSFNHFSNHGESFLLFLGILLNSGGEFMGHLSFCSWHFAGFSKHELRVGLIALHDLGWNNKNRGKSGENPGKIRGKSGETENPEKIRRKSVKNPEKIRGNSGGNPGKIWGKSGENPGKVRGKSGEIRGKSGENPGKIRGKSGGKSGENPDITVLQVWVNMSWEWVWLLYMISVEMGKSGENPVKRKIRGKSRGNPGKIRGKSWYNCNFVGLSKYELGVGLIALHDRWLKLENPDVHKKRCKSLATEIQTLMEDAIDVLVSYEPDDNQQSRVGKNAEAELHKFNHSLLASCHNWCGTVSHVTYQIISLYFKLLR